MSQVDIVHLADQIAAELMPSPFPSAATPLDLERLSRLGASAPQVDQLRTDAKELLIHTRELLK